MRRVVFIAALAALATEGCGANECEPLLEGSPWEGMCMNVTTSDVIQRPLRLHAEGGRIVNAAGEDVILRGVSLADPLFLADESLTNHFCEADFYTLAREWGANVVRAPIHPDLWLSHPDYAARFVDPVVEWAGKYGMYVLVGWHAHGNPVTGRAEPSESEGRYPWTGNPCNPDLELAKSALTVLAGRYGQTPWVLFEPFNEPAYIDWSDWRPVAEELVDTVQSAAPEALLLVSGTDWGYDLRGAIGDPVRRDNIVYSTHAYPGKGDGWKTFLRTIRQTSPVIIGEWGFRENCCNPNLDATARSYALPLLALAREEGIGWIAWVWHPFWEPPLLASWDGYATTEFGSVVMSALAAP